jgi:formate dehydrogenase accessory protein FdhD
MDGGEGERQRGTEWHAAWRLGAAGAARVDTAIAEEVPVALVYNGVSHAVMMASPTELEAFALGFSLSEGIIEDAAELLDLEIADAPGGIEISMRITARRFAGLGDRRRVMAGRTGCGLCGIDSLAQIRRELGRLGAGFATSQAAIHEALEALPLHQALNRATGAVHAAAWCDRNGAVLAACEDVGRHNALDKLIGRLARDRRPRPEGFALITSRCSYEMVQKAALAGIPMLVAISAPTSLAIEMAEQAGLTLVALARSDSITAYAHPWRVTDLEKAPTR